MEPSEPTGAVLGTPVEEPPQGSLLSLGSLQPRTAVLLASTAVAIVSALVMSLLPVPYAAAAAGPVTDTLGEHDGTALISIQGQQTYPTEGALDLTTVRIYGGPGSRVSPVQLVAAWLDPARVVVPEEAVFPPQQSAEEATEENRLEMVSSQKSATAAALRALGHDVGEEVSVAAFGSASKAQGELKVGDVIVSVNGVATPDGDRLRAQLQRVEPGEVAPMTVRRNGKELNVRPRTYAGEGGATALGIMLTPDFDFPFEVRIEIENVGGSSAGMMFALGIIDKLTPGALTHGAKVAGTGTIDEDGNVGPIGFIQQKMVGARRAGATLFLAPAANCDEVVGHVPDGLSVIRVETLSQARDALEQIAAGKGEQGLARCGSGG